MTESENDSAARYCPACLASAATERGEKNGYRLLVCRCCRTLRTARLPHAGEEEDYDGYYRPENLQVPAFVHRRLDEIVAGFSAYRQEGRLLDVGCGAGAIMQAAARAAWVASGTEISRTAAEHNRAQGFEVFCGELAAARYPEGHFDVVVTSEVIEHVPDPRVLLAEINRVLRPGGLLWATTPHARGLSAHALGLKWSIISPPEHLHLFSASGLKQLLREVGFRRTRLDTEGTNPFEIWRNWRPRANSATTEFGEDGFQRVESSYQLNEFMTQSASRQMAKRAINWMLNLSRLGDSLKIWAEK